MITRKYDVRKLARLQAVKILIMTVVVQIMCVTDRRTDGQPGGVA